MESEHINNINTNDDADPQRRPDQSNLNCDISNHGNFANDEDESDSNTPVSVNVETDRNR